MRCFMVSQQNSVHAISLFVFANSGTETWRESCIIHFPITQLCSTRVDVLETGDVPILYSLPQMQNLGITLELAPKGAKITCPAFGLYSSPVEYTTMEHIVLDLTSVAYQPKSRERSARPRKHLTFALSQRKSAYLARVQKLDDDEDDKPSVQPTSVLKRESSAIRSDPTPLRRRKRPPVWRDSSATLEQDASGNTPERSEDISGLGKSDGEALQKISQQVVGCSQLETPSSEALPHVHCAVQEENNPLGYSWKCV